MKHEWGIEDPNDIMNKTAAKSAQLGLQLMSCLNLSRVLYSLGIKSSSAFMAHSWFQFVKRQNVRRTE